MTTENHHTMHHADRGGAPAQDHRIRSAASKAERFTLHLLEMLLAMMAGMPLLYLLRRLVPPSSSYAAALAPGTILSAVAMAVFMTLPMAGWMMLRGHGWRHSTEMALAMFAPVAVIICLRLLGTDTHWPWLTKASHPAMPLAMILAMLYRREHYTGSQAGHRQHVHPAQEENLADW